MEEGEILFDRLPDYSGGKKAAPAAAATSEHPRVSSEDQRAKDLESRAILEAELAKNITWFEENNRKPLPDDPKAAKQFKDRLDRTANDIESLKREISRKGPAPEALPAATPIEAAEVPVGEGDVKFGEVPVYSENQDTGNRMGITSAQAAIGAGSAGALLGASRTPDYRQTFVNLAKDVYGVPVETVENYLREKYPQPATGEQIARDIARQEIARRSAAPAATVAENVANTGNLVTDKHGTVRWVEPRVSTKIGIPSALTDQIITLTGGANVSGSGENILEQNAQNVRKLKAMGYDVANMPKEGDLLLAQNYRTRAPALQQPDVWRSGRGTLNYQLPSEPADRVAQLGRTRPQVDMAAGLPVSTATPVAAAPARAPAPAVAPAVAPAAPPIESASYLDDLQKRIQKAGGLAEVLSRGAKAGLYGGATAMSGLDLWHAINSMMQNGMNPENIAQGAEGAGFLGALKYPRVGLGVAGGAKAERAGESMADIGVTPANAAAMASGLGIAAMPYGRYGAVAGAALQTPEAILAAKQWLLDHPEFGKKLQLQQGSQTWGQSRFGLD